MKHTWKIFALFAALALIASPRISAFLSANPPAATAQAAGAPSPAGETSKNVNLQFEVVPPALSGGPNLLVQLDNSVLAGEADATFAGLQDGLHTARVILMDANDQPLQGGIAMVHFRVHSTPAADSLQAAPSSAQQIQGAAPAPPPLPPELRGDGDPGLPLHGSPLLLVSLIGFALLIGGILPGIRPRKVNAAHS